MKPFLYDVVNTLYKAVESIMPEFIRERAMFNAFVLGSAGTFGVIKGLQALSRKFMDKVIPYFNRKYLPIIEKAGLAVITAAPLVYAAVDPEGAQHIVTQHPVYTSGMAGAYLGAAGAVVHDLHKQSLEDKLDLPLRIFIKK